MKHIKTENSNQRTAEEWVALARIYGEDCVKAQRDSSLSADQKIEKQSTLTKAIIVKIQDDAYLSPNDKKQMIESIQSYMDEWKRLSVMLRGDFAEENCCKQTHKH